MEQLYSRFPRKDAFVIGLYERITRRLHTLVSDAPAGTVADRFQFFIRNLLKFLEPNRELLQHLLPAMLNPADRLGVLGQSTDFIRAEVQGLYTVLILGSTDAPDLDETDSLVKFLYFCHLGLVFLYLQDQSTDDEFIENNLLLACDFITIARKTLIGSKKHWLVNRFAEFAGFPNPEQLNERVDRLVGECIRPPHDSAHFSTAENVLRELFRFRRLQPSAEESARKCASEPCRECLALHLPKVQKAMAENVPIPLVLPAFPAKSANRNKVTGVLPDFGEELALRFLQERCDAIAAIYEPGAHIVICSDGRVFSDVVGVADDHVTNYREALIEMIERLKLPSLQVFDLDDVRPNEDFDATRLWLMENYGEPLELLEERTKSHDHHQQLFNGIHRFLFEDLVDSQPELSRTQARKQSKASAYEVIRRSNAWSRLVDEFFSAALRLSIHPHTAHSEKIGILLGDADDLWLTPWHGVALLRDDRYVLTRRSQAEEYGASLVTRNGRPSHFEIVEAEVSQC